MYPNAAALMSGYFHEDWQSEQDTPEDVIKQFVASEPRDVVREAAVELKQLISSALSDESLVEVYFRQLGSYYDPRPSGMDVRSWLSSVADYLVRSTD